MKRRAFLKSALILGAMVFGPAHTPYRQWKIYRKRYLLILTSKTDRPSYPLGKRLAEILAFDLPASKARVTRAPHTRRIGSLISSKQMDVALLSRKDAVALMEGRDDFRGLGPLELRALFEVGGYLLVCRRDFPDAHAYLVARTLDRHRGELPEARVPDALPGTVPLHAGAVAYLDGRPVPGEMTLGTETDDDALEDHPHPHPHLSTPDGQMP
ncbi:MAG: hypothetical protein ACE5KF_06470 [Kiloniellaceae bacterium]